jgi:hypothetical protein
MLLDKNSVPHDRVPFGAERSASLWMARMACGAEEQMPAAIESI